MAESALFLSQERKKERGLWSSILTEGDSQTQGRPYQLAENVLHRDI